MLASYASTVHVAFCSPKVCREAIDLGLELYQEQKFAEAIAMWQKALELPGSGAMRLAGTVREFRQEQHPADDVPTAALQPGTVITSSAGPVAP